MGIGNVTGSNSVNVFLGIGLPWMIGAFFWKAQGQSVDQGRYQEWYEKYLDLDVIDDYPDGDVFVVPAGALGFSVAIFCILATVVLTTFCIRRQMKSIGGELGGPPTSKKITSGFFVMVWVTFLICYITKTLDEKGDCD